jgi:hypothetical protein
MNSYIESYNMGYVETFRELDFWHKDPLFNINNYCYDPFLEDKGRFDKIGFLMGRTDALIRILKLKEV